MADVGPALRCSRELAAALSLARKLSNGERSAHAIVGKRRGVRLKYLGDSGSWVLRPAPVGARSRAAGRGLLLGLGAVRSWARCWLEPHCGPCCARAVRVAEDGKVAYPPALWGDRPELLSMLKGTRKPPCGRYRRWSRRGVGRRTEIPVAHPASVVAESARTARNMKAPPPMNSTFNHSTSTPRNAAGTGNSTFFLHHRAGRAIRTS
jgi:hypothetical protein